MSATEIGVLIGGLGVIGLLAWFFFGQKEVAPEACGGAVGAARLI